MGNSRDSLNFDPDNMNKILSILNLVKLQTLQGYIFRYLETLNALLTCSEISHNRVSGEQKYRMYKKLDTA